MKVGLCTIAFQDRPLEEVIAIASAYGFDGVEIWGKPPPMPEVYDAEYVEKTRNLVLAKGLEVSAFGSYVHPLMPLHQKHFETAAKSAQGLGTKLLRIWSRGGASKVILSTDKRSLFFRLTTLSQWAQFRDLTLGLEMHNNNFTDSVDTILELFDYVKSPALKTYLQPSFRPDADDPIEAVERLKGQIVNVHAQNADESRNGCAIADGVVDYAEVVQKLADTGYDGYLEVEFVHGDDKLGTLQRDRDFLVSLIETVEFSQNDVI